MAERLVDCVCVLPGHKSARPAARSTPRSGHARCSRESMHDGPACVRAGTCDLGTALDCANLWPQYLWARFDHDLVEDQPRVGT